MEIQSSRRLTKAGITTEKWYILNSFLVAKILSQLSCLKTVKMYGASVIITTSASGKKMSNSPTSTADFKQERIIYYWLLKTNNLLCLL